MAYEDAKRRIRVKRILGIVIWMLCFFAWLILTMRALDASHYSLAPIRSIIIWIYENVPLFPIVWHYAPVIDQMSREAVIAIYALVFGGFAVAGWLFQSARVLAARLRRIDEQIEDQIIQESIRPGPKRSIVAIRHEIVVPKPSVWNLLHKTYLAPLMVQVVGAILAVLILYRFGFKS